MSVSPCGRMEPVEARWCPSERHRGAVRAGRGRAVGHHRSRRAGTDCSSTRWPARRHAAPPALTRRRPAARRLQAQAEHIPATSRCRRARQPHRPAPRLAGQQLHLQKESAVGGRGIGWPAGVQDGTGRTMTRHPARGGDGDRRGSDLREQPAPAEG